MKTKDIFKLSWMAFALITSLFISPWCLLFLVFIDSSFYEM